MSPTANTSGRRPVVCQEWEESERGWGVRPDGYSLHLTETDCRWYIAEYWRGMPDKNDGWAPEEYSRPSGRPYLVDVDAETYAQLEGAGEKRGLRVYNQPAPARS